MKISDARYNGKTEIKNIILDWGGVITDLHFDRAKIAFKQIGTDIFDENVPHDADNELFTSFETGRISAAEFRSRIRNHTAMKLTDDQIDKAWCSVLGDLPADRWLLLEQLNKYYHTFLLSNTNEIHRNYYYKFLNGIYGTRGFSQLFKKTYFSFELGMRKPDAEIYSYVLQDSQLDPGETLFIDDFIENIETASQLGIQTIHLKHPLTLLNFFEPATV